MTALSVGGDTLLELAKLCAALFELRSNYRHSRNRVINSLINVSSESPSVYRDLL